MLLRCFISCIILSFSISSCQKKTPLPKVPQQCLRINIPSDPSTIDPRKGGDLTSAIFHFLLFDGLVRLNENGKFTPSLAESISLSEDRTVYTFRLREAYWSDGTPITAWDFEKSWKDILNPEFPAMNAHLLYPIKNAEGVKRGNSSLSDVGVKSLDAKTLEVTLERPTPYFLELIAFCTFYPVNADMDHSNPGWGQQLNQTFIFSGPFTVKEWKHNNLIILKKNPYYHRAENIVMEEIRLNVIDNEMTALQMFEKGEIDILGQPIIPIPTDAIPELIRREKIITHSIPATTFCTFNVNKFPFNNPNIRKAFAYAINRKQIVAITQLNETPALNMIPPALKLNKPIHEYFQDMDIQAAQALFQKGLVELQITANQFPQIKLIYGSTEAHNKLAQTLQNQWKEALGVNVELERIDKKILLHLLKTRNYECALAYWMAQYNDPMNILERFKYKDNVKNYSDWQSDKYTSLLHLSYDAKSEEERDQYLDAAEQVLVDEMPIAPIFHWKSAYIVKPYVKSFGSVPIINSNFDQVYIDVEAKNSVH